MNYNDLLKELWPLLVKADHTQAEIINVIREPSQPKDVRRWVGQPQKTEESISTERYEKRLDSIRHENLSDPFIAYTDFLFFVSTLPSHIKNKVGPEIQQVNLAITMASRTPSWQEERRKRVMSLVVLYFVNKISVLLHEKNETTASQREEIEFDSFSSWLEENRESISESVAEALKKAFANLSQALD